MKDRDDVRMFDRGDGPRFAKETAKRLVAGVLRPNYLEGDGPAQIHVLGLVHDPHAAFAQFLDNPIVGNLSARLWRIHFRIRCNRAPRETAGSVGRAAVPPAGAQIAFPVCLRSHVQPKASTEFPSPQATANRHRRDHSAAVSGSGCVSPSDDGPIWGRSRSDGSCVRQQWRLASAGGPP
jgi:hypothetical protein